MVDRLPEKNILPPLTPKTTEAALYHQKVFLPKIAERLEQLARTALSIFVCGPNISDASNPITKKRIETVNALNGRGFNAFTGEQIVQELKSSDEKNGRPIRTDNIYELQAASQSDLVIVFRASPGSVAELHEFLNIPEIADKTLVFADKAHKEGYSSVGALAMKQFKSGKVEYYDFPEDIEKCRLKTQALEYAEFYRVAKGMREQGLSL